MNIIDREIGGLKQPTYEVSTAMSDLNSGEMITVAFGKIAKAVSTLISHVASKATSSVLGHVKLSDSTSSTSASTAGVAATPKAVKAAYDLANSNTEKIGTTDISGIGDGTVTGAIVNNKEAIEDVSQSLTNKLDASNVDPMFCESIPGRNQITNFLHVDLSNRNSYINKIHYFGSNNPAAEFVNSPYTAGSFFGYRVVRWCSNSANEYHLVTAELHEQYPVSGRVWSNTYDIVTGTWYGWKCNQGNTFIDVGTVLKGTTTISAGATVTYTATRDCFVNVAAYAHGSGQNTKIYINNVCIFSPYTNNGSDAGLVIVDKTVPLKTGQTIKIENGTYTTSSYAIFAAF